MLKLADNPPMLYPTTSSVRDIPGTWWVAHTKARNEKAFAWDLITHEVPFYLPLIRRTTFSGGRRRHGMLPLFPSYVFVAPGDESRAAVSQSDRLCNLIEVHGQSQLIDELESIEHVIAAGIQLDPCPFAVVGKLVRIARGPFKGIVGRVIRKDNVLRLVVQVSILGRGAEMEIDSDVLEAAE